MRKIYKSLAKMRLNLRILRPYGRQKAQNSFRKVTPNLKGSVKFTQYKFVNLILNLRKRRASQNVQAKITNSDFLVAYITYL